MHGQFAIGDHDHDGIWEWGSESDILDAAKEIQEEGYGDILRLIDNLGMEEDKDGSDADEWVQCTAETNNGDQCSNKAKAPEDDPKFCANHRHLLN